MSARRPFADSTTFAMILILLFGAIYAVIAQVALDAFPYSGDEYSLVLQSELFARGLLKAPMVAHAEWLRVDHVVIDAWVRSKYPPGASALLAIGTRYGAAWLVTPIEGMVTVAVVWHTIRRMLGPREALVGLVALGLAPLFVFNASSFFAHTPATMFLALAYAAIASWTLGERTGWLIAAGVAIGCAFVTRPVDALLFGAAMLAMRSPRAVLITAASALPFVVLNLAYQDAQFGGPLIDGYHAYEPTFRALYGAEAAANPLSLGHLVSATQQWNHIDVIRALCVDWTIPGTVIAALFGAYAIGRDHRARRLHTFSIGLVLTFLVALLPMIADVDDGARPRYLSVTLLPISFLAAAGFAPLGAAIAGRFGDRIRTLFVTVAIVFGLAQTAHIVIDRVPRIWKREGLYQAVAEQGLRDAVVVVRAESPSLFARNGPWFTGVLYLSTPAEVPASAVVAAYPDRDVWEAFEGVPWRLTQLARAPR